jgi:hypothetical protein
MVRRLCQPAQKTQFGQHIPSWDLKFDRLLNGQGNKLKMKGYLQSTLLGDGLMDFGRHFLLEFA